MTLEWGGWHPNKLEYSEINLKMPKFGVIVQTDVWVFLSAFVVSRNSLVRELHVFLPFVTFGALWAWEKFDSYNYASLPWSQRFFLSRKKAAKQRIRVAKRYLGLEFHFHADAAVKRVKLMITKESNGNLAITHCLGIYQSNGPIILICVFVKVSTNPSLTVRSWP